MNDTPASIRARIHESAIRRVTRAYDAASIFVEVLQNARRGGAGRVRVTVARPEIGPLTVTVADDGIADPSVLLSFGENGWNEDLVRREDTAGMGMLSLARRHRLAPSARAAPRLLVGGSSSFLSTFSERPGFTPTTSPSARRSTPANPPPTDRSPP